MVTIRVPASSANLGPGFDSLGLAMGLSLNCQFEESDGLHIAGCPEKYRGPDNLVYRAFARAADKLDYRPPGLSIHMRSDIPVGKGLGSSAALILAGIAGAYALSGAAIDKAAIFQLAAHMEGHPDNVAAACFGGLTAAMAEEGRWFSAGFPLCDSLRFTALIPDFELSTETSRVALPGQISLRDAAHNQAHSLMLLSALEKGDLALLRYCLRDRWHQPWRLPLIKDGQALWHMAEDMGACLYLSGAGPSLMCVHQDEGLSNKLGIALKERYPAWQALPLLPDRQGLMLV